MISICDDLYVRVCEMPGERAPQPRPLANGFAENVAYRVLGVQSASESSEAYLILSNERQELWFIPSRHVRAYAVLPGNTRLRFAVVPETEVVALPGVRPRSVLI